ncbi:hypothetical protein ACKKBG_A23570 [Auxenochlorella protothecoides x Auxenochlorella symbiontica]
MCSLPTGIVPCAPLPPRGVLLARPTQGLAGRVSPHRAIGRHRMPTPQAAAAAADGMAGFGAYQSGAYSQEGLDFQPRLSRTDVAASAGVALGVCCSVYALAAPRVVSLWFGTCMAALAGTSLACTRALLLERQHKALQRSEEEWVRLLKAGTSLVPFRRSRLHVATFPPGTGSSTSDLRIHCLHGFGSALHSWLAVGPHIAAALGATITAHDMPGFGLSERPAQDEPYTLAYNGEAARFIMDEVAKSEAGATGGPCKRVLMGHSMGAVSVADEVIRDPQGYRGIVLVSPAIFAAKVPGQPPARHNQALDPRLEAVERVVEAEDAPSPPNSKPWAQRLRLCARALQFAAARVILRLARPFIVLTLRSRIRKKNFWRMGLTSAWYDASRLQPETVDRYRFPQLIRGWETGFCRFLAARFAEKGGLLSSLRVALHGPPKPSQAERLAEVVRQHGIPCLIVHGEGDRAIPATNSRALAQALPGSKLVMLSQCGHVPQEEIPGTVATHISAFLREL